MQKDDFCKINRNMLILSYVHYQLKEPGVLNVFIRIARWIVAISIVDVLSSVVCIAIAVTISAAVGGSTGYVLSVLIIATLFSLAGLASTALYFFANGAGAISKRNRQSVRLIIGPLGDGWTMRHMRRFYKRPVPSALFYLASSYFLGGIITMVLRTEHNNGNRERFFWPLLLISTSIYGIKLGLIYGAAGWGAVEVIGRFF